MECPVDAKALETHTTHSIEVEECPQCRGLWFEKGELRKARDEAEPDLNWLDFDLWSDENAFEVAWSSRKCPECGKDMAKISYGTTGETVDYCVEGHEAWLDKGGFDDIIRALDMEVHTKSVPDYIVASLEEAKEIVRIDEGFVSEWNDFLTVTRLLQYRVLAENPTVAQALVGLQLTSPLR